jgi:hypothetical protein
MLNDRELEDIFADEPSPTRPPKRPPNTGRSKRRPPRVIPIPLDLSDLEDDLPAQIPDDNLPDSDPTSRLLHRLLSYFDRTSRYLVTEFRSTFESLFDTSESDSELIESTLSELEEAIKQEFRRFPIRTLGMKKLAPTFFEPFSVPFHRPFKDATQFVKASNVSHSYSECCGEVISLTDRLRSNLMPFVDSLNGEIMELTHFRFVLQFEDGNNDDTNKRQLWDLEARLAAQKIQLDSVNAKLSEVSVQPEVKGESDVADESLQTAISELEQKCESYENEIAKKCEEKIGKIRQNREEMEGIGEELKKVSEMMNRVIVEGRQREKTEVRRSDVRNPIEMSKIGTRRSAETRMTQLQSVLKSMEKERETELENVTMFLEEVENGERANRKQLKRKRDPSMTRQSERTLWHY